MRVCFLRFFESVAIPTAPFVVMDVEKLYGDVLSFDDYRQEYLQNKIEKENPKEKKKVEKQ